MHLGPTGRWEIEMNQIDNQFSSRFVDWIFQLQMLDKFQLRFTGAPRHVSLQKFRPQLDLKLRHHPQHFAGVETADLHIYC